ncbi:STAS domain-containing protein [Niallia sp. NCCP-28]|uniref:STAS domain-containing protein n=1 Tax=Niallia sp. NCCP-28 TaxID=2934712 RepID=UPI002086B332|nr:STAS domain-containing protein [Niallia sp. NCCP-28]GKU82056.1 RsbT co-antagonist protein RsbRD [Niallia sp. NCCP-28]
MKAELSYLGEAIVKKKYEIARVVHEERLEGVREEDLRELKKVENEIINIRANFIELFGEALKNRPEKDGGVDKFSKWGKETGAAFCAQGVPLNEALQDASYYRRSIWKVIKEEVMEHHMSLDIVFEVGGIIDPLLDHAVHSFSLAYVDSYSETFNNTRRSFLELSVPVVPLTDTIAILPLVGDIDTERAKLLMEEALAKSKELGINNLIIDISGVMIVDTMVANELLKIINALRLLGVETIFTGIRPEIAQTIVSLGLDLRELTFMKSLKVALSKLQK